MNEHEDPAAESFPHLIRAGLAIVLALSLPFVLWLGPADTDSNHLLQAYQDVLAAVVAFYFGASADPKV